MVGCIRRHRDRVQAREAGEGLRVWRNQVKRHSVGGVVGHHAAREIAAAGMRGARSAAGNFRERVAILADDQVSLERPAEILRPDELPVREADASPEPERVSRSAVGRRRQRNREVWHQLRGGAAAQTPVRRQAVVHPFRRCPVPKQRVGSVSRPLRQQGQRTAAVAGGRELCVDPHQATRESPDPGACCQRLSCA